MSITDTNETQAPPSQVAPAARMQPPKIRLDKGRAHGTVHGDRPPEDRHAKIHFTQDGLYFDAGGILILDHPDYHADTPEAEVARRKLEKKIRLHMAKAARQPAQVPQVVTAQTDPDDDEDNAIADSFAEDDEEEDELEPINLSSWARGEQQVEWQDVTQEIARRYKKRVASIADAIPFLVKEGVCPPNEVAKKFKKFLD